METFNNYDKERFMNEAFMLARKAEKLGEIPVGAVIVKNGIIIGRGYNLTRTHRDPTAHAEMLCIKDASKRIKDEAWLLKDCSMFVTLEPCAMCAGAIVLARISNLFIGTCDNKTGACGSIYNIVSDGNLNHRVNVEKGVLEEECKKILKDFFSSLRNKRLSEENR